MKRVVLYKNGVGYFEHEGRVRGNEAVTISFTSSQLNDVLKSLTVLDLNGGRIAGVAYGTSAPTERQLEDLHFPAGEKSSLADFLAALRGTKLEVKSGAAVITGRMLSIDHKTRTSAGIAMEADYLSLITDSGELRTTELSPSLAVRLLEAGLPGKVGRFLDVVSAGARGGSEANGDIDRGRGRAIALRELHQRGAGLEIDIPHCVELQTGTERAVAGVGHCR